MSALPQISEQKQSIGFKQVLVATDFSEPSGRALAFALAITRRYGSALSVVHAIPPERREPVPLEPVPPELNRHRLEAEQKMKTLGDQIRMADPNRQLLVEQGRVWDVIASVIRREDIDLLILGTHGRGGLKKAVLGSVAEQVLRLAPCPVLTVGPQVPRPDSETIDFQRILFATDFAASAVRALPYALALTEDYRARLVLLHMVPPIAPPDLGPAAYGPATYSADDFMNWHRKFQDQSLSKLRALIPSNAKLASEPEFIAGVDFLPEGILQAAASYKIDLIIMGADRTSSPRLAAHLPWSLTHQIICHAHCPVLTVSN